MRIFWLCFFVLGCAQQPNDSGRSNGRRASSAQAGKKRGAATEQCAEIKAKMAVGAGSFGRFRGGGNRCSMDMSPGSIACRKKANKASARRLLRQRDLCGEEGMDKRLIEEAEKLAAEE